MDEDMVLENNFIGEYIPIIVENQGSLYANEKGKKSIESTCDF